MMSVPMDAIIRVMLISTLPPLQVALVSADFFSGSYLPALKATLASIGDTTRALVLAQHSPLLRPLVEALVLRTQLSPDAAEVATADARDIPDDARTVSVGAEMVGDKLIVGIRLHHGSRSGQSQDSGSFSCFDVA